MTALGFNQPLCILPFDNRGSFEIKMFGWKGTLSPSQTAEIATFATSQGVAAAMESLLAAITTQVAH